MPWGPEPSWAYSGELTVVSIYKSPSPFPRLNLNGVSVWGHDTCTRISTIPVTARVTYSILTRMSTPGVIFSGKPRRVSELADQKVLNGPTASVSIRSVRQAPFDSMRLDMATSDL